MKLGKLLRGLTFASSLMVIGCSDDVGVQTTYEDRHIHHHHDYDDTQVAVHVDEQDRNVPPPPPAPAPVQGEDTSVSSTNYDTGGERVDVDVDSVDAPPDYNADQDAQYFQGDLQPYGDWVVTAQFGRCFRPHGIAVGWRPYSVGHWVYTNDGWLWASDEPYGWATYHYGRWYQDASFGWCWVPGRTWAPAWVAWRHGGGCAGWAALPPIHSGDVNVSISVEVGHIHPDNYVFVDERYIDAPHVYSHARPVQQNVTIINNTTNITNITNVNGRVVNHGVDTLEVQRTTGHTVKKVTVVQASDKGTAHDNGNTVAVFKKDIPKKPPTVATNHHATDSHNTAQTFSADDTNTTTNSSSNKNKKTVKTDTTSNGKNTDQPDNNPPSKKKTTDKHTDTTLAADSGQSNSHNKPDNTNTQGDTSKTDKGTKSDDADPKSDSGKKDKHSKPDDSSSSGSGSSSSHGGKSTGSPDSSSTSGKNSGSGKNAQGDNSSANNNSSTSNGNGKKKDKSDNSSNNGDN